MYLKSFAGSEKIELKVVYGVENNSTFLECMPSSPQATVKWIMQQKHSQSTKEVRMNTRHTASFHGKMSRLRIICKPGQEMQLAD